MIYGLEKIRWQYSDTVWNTMLFRFCWTEAVLGLLGTVLIVLAKDIASWYKDTWWRSISSWYRFNIKKRRFTISMHFTASIWGAWSCFVRGLVIWKQRVTTTNDTRNPNEIVAWQRADTSRIESSFQEPSELSFTASRELTIAGSNSMKVSMPSIRAIHLVLQTSYCVLHGCCRQKQHKRFKMCESQWTYNAFG